ncbi:2TM domain-containing protein [Mesonia sp. K7]|uniref:2TM domain-containing protein n=1 Tax=Mesonia sp. K7 TaxID=2218606 RepID=UPI000DA76C35|nr:2TM domain-containing protein [Mesonia sp. K7]PZD78642.1 hypothetical protein DNG35_04085 [Mesonia sp. K7]
MASSTHPNIDPQQRFLIENAQRRVKQKKNLMRHFVIFIAGSVLFIILDLVLGFGKEINETTNSNWFVWAILIWFFFFLIHFINVFVVNRFMGKEWEEKQLEFLIEKQQKKINKLQEKIDKDYPLPSPEVANNEPNQPLPPKPSV